MTAQEQCCSRLMLGSVGLNDTGCYFGSITCCLYIAAASEHGRTSCADRDVTVEPT